MDLPIEDLLSSLPAEVLERPAELKASTSDESSTDDERDGSSNRKKASTSRKVPCFLQIMLSFEQTLYDIVFVYA